VIATEQECREVRRILAGIPEKDRQILHAVFFEERDKREICRTMGVDGDYLRVLLHRAKSRFRGHWLKRFATKSSSASPLG
jgi:RNA polymerase sigma-70 factor (ECF subfamily)